VDDTLLVGVHMTNLPANTGRAIQESLFPDKMFIETDIKAVMTFNITNTKLNTCCPDGHKGEKVFMQVGPSSVAN